MHRLLFLAALTLVASGVAPATPAAAGHHEAGLQVVSVRVAPGKMEKYLGKVKQLDGILRRHQSPAKVRVWNTTVGGPDTGNTIVGLEYPNAAAWAADSGKLQADSEWQKIVRGLDDIRTLESNSVWREISVTPMPAGSGGVLAVTAVQVKPGKLDAYRKRVDSARAITERLGLSGTLRMWQADVAGPNTGGVVVGIEYPDLVSYVSDQGKLAGDSEWRKLLRGLDELRTLGGRWIYQDVTP